MNHKKIMWGLGLFLALGWPNKFIAQPADNNIRRQSLEQLLQLVDQRNQQIKLAEYEAQLAQQDFQKTKSIFLPEIKATLTGTLTNLPLNAFGTQLNQGAIAQEDFAPASLNSPDAIDNLQTRLEVRQPIMNKDAMAMRRAASSAVLANEQQATRTSEAIKFELTTAYRQLQFLYQYEKLLQKNQETAQANLQLALDNLEAGYIQEVEVLSLRIRLTEIQDMLLNNQFDIQDASDAINQMTRQPLGQVIMPTDTLALSATDPLLSEKELTNRSDFQAMRYGIEGLEHQKMAANQANFPRLNAFASYEFNNRLSFSDVANGFLVGLQLSWDIFKGNKNASDRQKAQLQVEKAQLAYDQKFSQSQVELKMAQRSLQRAESQIELSEALVAQAIEQLRIKRNRYSEGLEKTTDLLNSETDLAQKQFKRVKALLDYNIAAARINFLLEQ